MTYGFDGADRPSAVAWGATPLVTSASYLSFGPVREIVFGNGTTQTMTRDARYLPLTNQLVAGPVTLASYTYATDTGGNITEIHDATNGAWNRNFGYDDLNRLTSANGGASPWGTGTYSYDAMGNLTSTTLGSQTTQFAYSGTTPKLVSVNEPGGQVTVTYDAGGNETHDQEISARNLVASVGNAVVRTYNEFDGRGVRVRSETFPLLVADYSTYHAHIYSPELHALARPDAHAIRMWGIDFPFHTTEYVWFGDRPVAQLDSIATTTVRYTAADHLGTPFMQTDATANVVWRAEYEPYGNVYTMRTGKALDQPLRFPGQEASDGSGEVYNVFRWYRSGWGKYTQSDPLGIKLLGFELDHLYAYVQSDPVNLADSLGLYCGSEWSRPAPNSIPGVFDFREACRKHDLCYGTCGSKKGGCDFGFYNDMKKDCDTGGYGRWNCMKFAESYYYYVREHGKSAFDGAQKKACESCSVKEKKEGGS